MIKTGCYHTYVGQVVYDVAACCHTYIGRAVYDVAACCYTFTGKIVRLQGNSLLTPCFAQESQPFTRERKYYSKNGKSKILF